MKYRRSYVTKNGTVVPASHSILGPRQPKYTVKPLHIGIARNADEEGGYVITAEFQAGYVVLAHFDTLMEAKVMLPQVRADAAKLLKIARQS